MQKQKTSSRTAAVRLSIGLMKQAKEYSQIEHRSPPAQIEYWAKVGKCSIDNPDLSFEYIKDILAGVAELELGDATEYKFG